MHIGAVYILYIVFRVCVGPGGGRCCATPCFVRPFYASTCFDSRWALAACYRTPLIGAAQLSAQLSAPSINGAGFTVRPISDDCFGCNATAYATGRPIRTQNSNRPSLEERYAYNRHSESRIMAANVSGLKFPVYRAFSGIDCPLCVVQ